MIIKRFGVFASAVAVAVALAACGASKDENPAIQSTPAKGSLYEGAEKMAGCMRGLGWDITVDRDGGWRSTNGIPVAQKDQYEKDTADCEAKFGYDKPPPPLTQQQAEARYDALVAVGKCVKQLGYDIPPPPSKQKSVESMISSGNPLWDPYQYVVSGTNSSAELDKVFTKCPQP
ncbi:hypothetical protein [Dactylosporangium sp. NPDC005555]|uniref:hypothetical protein n=1 Tax=Dactylosporangium sp. NPDC005555 TaxID=3154889 RepID=UPI0033AFD7CB